MRRESASNATIASRTGHLFLGTGPARARDRLRHNSTVPALAFARAVVLLALALALPAAGAGKSVLLLQQDDDAWLSYQAFYAGFQGALAREYGADVMIYRENLDLSRFPGAPYRDALRRWYTVKYQAIRVDAIVAVGPAALTFALSARRDIWPGVPTVFAGGDRETLAIAERGAATGRMLQFETPKSIALARTLFPRTRNLAIVGDRDLTQTFFPTFDESLDRLAGELRVIDLRGLAMATLLERVAALPPDTIVHCTIFSLDGDGQRFVPRDALARIAAASNAPIFGDIDSYMGTGAVGGQMSSTRAFGAAIANHLAPVLHGALPAEPPPGGTNSWSTPVVDWRAIRRFGVDPARLPAGIEIRYREPSVWEEHRPALLGVAAAFLVLLGLVIRLLRERRQRIVAEQEASARFTELARANRISAAGELAASVVHDLGQPLAAIQSNVESMELLLEADPPRLEEARAALADVRRDDQRAADVIGRLRSLFHKSEPRRERVFVESVVNDVTRMAEGVARRKGVTVEADLDPAPMVVDADVVQLQQVLINLLLNALDAIPDGTGHRRVAIVARHATGGVIRVAVGDSGPGIPDDERARIFEPFYTTKSKGTGVGLAIVKRIVESYGTQVAVGVSPLGGAEFSFVLPSAEAAP